MLKVTFWNICPNKANPINVCFLLSLVRTSRRGLSLSVRQAFRQTKIRVHMTHENYVKKFGHSLLNADLLSFQPPKQPKKINERVMITN